MFFYLSGWLGCLSKCFHPPQYLCHLQELITLLSSIININNFEGKCGGHQKWSDKQEEQDFDPRCRKPGDDVEQVNMMLMTMSLSPLSFII